MDLLNVAGRSSAPAVTVDGISSSYGEVEERSVRLGEGLLALGLRPGDRFAFLLPNSLDILCCYIACAQAGLVGVPISQRVAANELAFQIGDCRPRALLYAPQFGPLLEGRSEFDAVEHLLTPDFLDRPHVGAGGSRPLLGGAALAPSAPFIIMYTGGTTGSPKAAIQTRESWACCLRSSVEEWALTPDDRHLIALPMSHAAWFTAGATMTAGGHVTIVRAWDPGRVLDIVEEQRTTTLNMIPTMLTDLLKSNDDRPRHVGSVRLLTVAGSLLPEATLHRAREVFGDVIGNIYGLTEAAGPVTFLHPRDASSKAASVGRPGRFIELAILDERGDAATSPGVKGEVGLAGPQITVGYWNRAPETEAAFSGRWFRTGDIGQLDDEGFLSIVGRSKDMIKTGGFNVYPGEIEEVIYQQPEVLECAVIGIADAKWSESIQAVVVFKPGHSCSDAELVARCRAVLAGHKVPKAIHRYAKLPRTSFGKFDKVGLKREIEALRERPPSSSP